MKFLEAHARKSCITMATSLLLLAYLNVHQHRCCASALSSPSPSSLRAPSTNPLRSTTSSTLSASQRNHQRASQYLLHAHEPSSSSTLNIPKHQKRSHSISLPFKRRRKRQDVTSRDELTLENTASPSSPSLSVPSSVNTSLPPHGLPSPQPLKNLSTSTAATSQPIALLVPQEQLNATLRSFPFTPKTGASHSLELTPNVPSRDGLVEIRVGVLLPYSLPNNLTQHLALSGTSAIRLAVSEINENRLIPGAYITLVLKDSFNGLDPDNSGAAQAIFSTVSLLQTGGGVTGVIGDVSSALSVQSALLTSRLSIPQCSYSAGSTQLSSKDDYGHFFRTIPTELMFGRVMMDFVVSREWKTIAVFYTGDSLGSKMMDKITQQAAKRNIRIGYKRAFWESDASSDVKPALEALVDSGQRIIMVAAVGIPQMHLMVEAVKMGLISKDYVWLAINQVAEPLLNRNSNLKPTDLNGLFMFDNLLKLHGYTPYEQFLDKWAALDPLEYPYAGQRDISSNEPQAYSCMMVMAGGFAEAVKGNWTALHLLAAGKLGDRLKPMDMNVNYTGPGGPMIFDENGDVEHGNFILYNFQNGQVVPIGTSYSGVFNLSSPPMYFDGTFTTPVDTAPLRVLNPKFGSPIGMVLISIASLSILFSLLTMLVVIVYRDTQVIKASSPLFCCLELCGFILLYISTVAGLDIPTYFVCIARPLTLNVGFVLVVGNIVAKNFRVYRIFHNIYVTKRVIKDAHLLKIVGTMLVGSLIVMVVWFIKTPPTLQQIIMSDFTTYWTCSSASGPSTPYLAVLFVYNAVLLLVATYLAYKNRNVAANYNECRQIAFVVYNILLSACLAMPTVFLPEEQFLTKFFLSTVVILFGTTFSLMFLFLPKLWELFTQIERAHQRGGSNGDGGGAEGGSDESSIDGFVYNGASAWMNSAGNLAILGQGADFAGAIGGNGASVNASSHYLPDRRKGSVGTLDEGKGDIVKEIHMGYMGVRFRNRYLPFLSSWCMRRVVLYPHCRYFTCFELGKPETGKTFTYVSVFIHSRDPGAYILRVIGCGRFDFLLQVRDEERLLHWYNLFDNCREQGNPAHSDGSAIGTVLPLGNLTVSNLSTTNAHLCPISVTDVSTRPGHSHRCGSDQILQGSKDHLLVCNCSADSDRARSFASYYNSIDNADLDNGQLTSSSNGTLAASSPISNSNRISEVDKMGIYRGTICRHGNGSIEGCRVCQSSWSDVRIRNQVGYEGGSELRHEHNVMDLSTLPRVEDGSNRIEGETLELSDRQQRFRQAEWQGEGVDKGHSHSFNEA